MYGVQKPVQLHQFLALKKQTHLSQISVSELLTLNLFFVVTAVRDLAENRFEVQKVEDTIPAQLRFNLRDVAMQRYILLFYHCI